MEPESSLPYPQVSATCPYPQPAPFSSLPYSQVSATCPYPEPAPSSPHNPLPLPEDPSFYFALPSITLEHHKPQHLNIWTHLPTGDPVTHQCAANPTTSILNRKYTKQFHISYIKIRALIECQKATIISVMSVRPPVPPSVCPH
jgi:hypothetical protein